MRRFDALSIGDIAMSVVTFGELYRGALRHITPRLAIDTLQQITEYIPVLPMPERTGECYGRIRVDLERSGMVIGNNDLWIAAHALATGLTLVTGNVREFRRVKGLVIEDWISR
jgi:tRNA(fMet)-specific endonuclease VapC